MLPTHNLSFYFFLNHGCRSEYAYPDEEGVDEDDDEDESIEEGDQPANWGRDEVWFHAAF
jgi:hypothetical protein